MNMTVQGLQKIKAALAPKEIWNTTVPDKRIELVFEALSACSITTMNNSLTLFQTAVNMSYDNGVVQCYVGWSHTHQQMVEVFDMAIRLAKLQTFS
jgi:hypothetical protein